MSLACLLSASKKFPPGHIKPESWPRLSGNNHRDQTYDPPVYQIPGFMKTRLVNYYEEEIYFSLKTDYVMPREDYDGVVKVMVVLFGLCSFEILNIPSSEYSYHEDST